MAGRLGKLLLVLWFTFILWTVFRVISHAETVPQSTEAKNPLAGNREAIDKGRKLFKRDCAPCHGVDASGARGPDLTSGRMTHGDGDAQLFKVVSKGIVDTEMPGGYYEDRETWAIIAFLRSVVRPGQAGSKVQVTGDDRVGESLFAQLCSQCHQVNGKGGRLGPDLSRIGVARSIGHLTESIRHASKDVPVKYDTLIALTKDGKRITGIRLNEDTFSLQMMDERENIHLWRKRDLQEVIYERRSLMPDYDESVLSQKALQDLLAYLQSLRGKEGQ